MEGTVSVNGVATCFVQPAATEPTPEQPADAQEPEPETKEERLERLLQSEISHNAAASRRNNSPYAKDYPELCCAVDRALVVSRRSISRMDSARAGGNSPI